MAPGRTVLRIVGATVTMLVVAVLAAVVGRFAAKPARRPNVFIISVDTLRVDRLGVYGHTAARTPNIDGLAEGGILFTQATTPLPRTTPALASLFSGLWPQHHGSREVAQKINDDIPTLAEILRRNGYTTLGVSGNVVASPRQGLDRGFDRFFSPAELKHIAARGITKRTLDEVARMPADKPLFLWLHYIDPHYQYRPPKRWKDQPEAHPCRELMADATGDRWLAGEVHDNRDGRSEAALPACLELYDAEIAFADYHIGRLLGGLQEVGRLDDALVVFTSDHGENMGEKGLYYEHGPSVHDASMRVPLIIHGPDLPAKIDDEAIRLEDLMPTLLAYLGIGTEDWPPMDGIDLSKRLLRRRGRPKKDEVPLAFTEGSSSLHANTFHRLRSGARGGLSCVNVGNYSLCAERNGKRRLYDHEADPDLEVDLSDRFPRRRRQLFKVWRHWPPESARERTARTPRFKLVEYPDPGGGYRRALYDLETDPAETTDVTEDHPQVFIELRTALDRWTSSIEEGSPNTDRDEETLEALRALGYLK
jgi:arylsulfatase